MPIKSPNQVREEFVQKGIAISQWAAANGLEKGVVYGVLSGRKKALRGEAHRAAILLGMKVGEVIDQADVKSALSTSGMRRAA